MKRVEFSLDDHIQSANFINQNWDKIEKWWWSDKVQN